MRFITEQSEPLPITRRTLLQASGLAVAGSYAARGSRLFAAEAAAAPSASAVATDAPNRRPGLKLGIASYTFRKFDLDQTIAMTKRAALQYVCLKSFHLPLDADDEQIRDAASKVRQAGLTLYACGVVTMHTEAQIQQAFHYAKTAGMEMIVAAPSAEMLPMIEKFVKETGLRIAIHNHGPGDKHFPTPESVYDKVKNLDERIGLCIDVGHTVRIGGDLLAATKKCADRLYDVHIKDVTEAAPKGREIEAGRGVIDLVSFLRLLREIRYAGVMAFEHESDPVDPLPGLSESVGYVRGVWDTLTKA